MSTPFVNEQRGSQRRKSKFWPPGARPRRAATRTSAQFDPTGRSHRLIPIVSMLRRQLPISRPRVGERIPIVRLLAAHDRAAFAAWILIAGARRRTDDAGPHWRFDRVAAASTAAFLPWRERAALCA